MDLAAKQFHPGPSLSDEEINAVLRSCVARTVPAASPEWRSMVAREVAQRRIVLRYWRNVLFGWAVSSGRRKKKVEDTYDHIWTQTNPATVPDGIGMLHQWRHEGFVLSAPVTQKFQLDLVAKALRIINPSSVIEIGSGWGLNLFVLSGQLPQTRFQGIDLTKAGIDLARSIAAADKLPEDVLRHMPAPPADPTAHRRVTVDRGSADRLPYPDSSFDVVITRLALEQMESIRDAALSEIARVARSHVIMVESFREMNDAGIRRQYMVGNNYFRGRIADLPQYGLEPEFVFSDWPHKVVMKPIFVLAKKIRSATR